MQTLKKGKISSLSADGTTARVLPLTSEGVVTRPLVVPFYLRKEWAQLAINTEIIYCEFEDHTGMVLMRADGEWTATIPEDVHVLGDVKVNATSFLNHTHACPDGSTGGPQ